MQSKITICNRLAKVSVEIIFIFVNNKEFGFKFMLDIL